MARDRVTTDITAASAAMTAAELMAVGLIGQPLTRRQERRLARLLRLRFRGCLRAYRDRKRWSANELSTER